MPSGVVLHRVGFPTTFNANFKRRKRKHCPGITGSPQINTSLNNLGNETERAFAAEALIADSFSEISIESSRQVKKHLIKSKKEKDKKIKRKRIASNTSTTNALADR
jgi:hypothetical protein